ncbi:hypothetical protein HBI75_175900 [Parastagonospora nodorum]|nr:hypothetical protein HBI75_175900 [Parastagonospora nodorum]
MLQTNIREGYKITTLEVIKLIEDFISYLAVAKYTQLQNAQIPKVFYKAASSSIISNRSTALITNKFSVALLTKPAILNNANITLVDAQKLEKNYFKVRAQHLKYNVIDALMMTLIKNNNDLLGTINSYIKLRRLRARYKTKAADSRHAKVSRRRTKKDKDLENSNTSSDVLRLYSLLDSDDYCLDSSLDINPKDNLEDEEAMILTTIHSANKQTRTRDSLSARVETAIEHCTLEEELVTTLLYTSLQTHTSSTSKSYYLIINITQLTIIISYILLKARERSTMRAKGASSLTLNLNKQLQ